MRTLGVVVFAIAVACGTFFVLPAIVYISVIWYEVPAAVFVLAGYGIWRLLVARLPILEMPFLIAFSAPVVFVLFFGLLLMKPVLVLYVVMPTLVTEILRRRPWNLPKRS